MKLCNKLFLLRQIVRGFGMVWCMSTTGKQHGPATLLAGLLVTFTGTLVDASDAFSLDQHRWKIRTLVISAPNASDENLKKQRREVAMYAEEFADRDMVLITLLEDAASTVGERQLTAEEAVALRDALRIQTGSFAVRLVGKDGSVKLSRDTATPMAEIYALIDTMPMRQREMTIRSP
jgi:hypothetical protein